MKTWRTLAPSRCNEFESNRSPVILIDSAEAHPLTFHPLHEPVYVAIHLTLVPTIVQRALANMFGRDYSRDSTRVSLKVPSARHSTEKSSRGLEMVCKGVTLIGAVGTAPMCVPTTLQRTCAAWGDRQRSGSESGSLLEIIDVFYRELLFFMCHLLHNCHFSRVYLSSLHSLLLFTLSALIYASSVLLLFSVLLSYLLFFFLSSLFYFLLSLSLSLHWGPPPGVAPCVMFANLLSDDSVRR